ncbi:mRNA-decapping enzyme subunit 2 [Acrasis kona]|uniref:mRNA-decapping enzyme subunit 2 n=1 Tax=Acrasis kona TaxID=1008807 RepID=A0AAW2Z0H1_9EUKA
MNQNVVHLAEVLEDLLIRFVLNCPKEEQNTVERMFFQLEEAYWFYLDFYKDNKNLPNFKFKEFTAQLLALCPILGHYRQSLELDTKSFYKYKNSVPTCGAILFNKDMTKVLLVKGCSEKSSWSFPRGKINQAESEFDCAAREVMEEVGFDIVANGANKSDFILLEKGEQRAKLFVVKNVQVDYKFTTLTRGEVSDIGWHTLVDLHNSKGMKEYWAVTPYLTKIYKWLKSNKNVRPLRSFAKNIVIKKTNQIIGSAT